MTETQNSGAREEEGLGTHVQWVVERQQGVFEEGEEPVEKLDIVWRRAGEMYE
jgi:hypothetical protein